MSTTTGTSKPSKIDWQYKNPILIDHVYPPPEKDTEKPFFFILDTEATCNQTEL